MPCTEAYKEHIEYTFNAFCRVVIHYAAINAWRDRDKRRQREISFEYLTEEKFYPFCTSDTYFIDPYKQYPVNNSGFSRHMAHILHYLISLHITSSAYVTDLPVTHLPRLYRSFHSRLMLSTCVPTVLFICGTGI